ncbi:MAG: ImmA/IrrE family metallo-endopeptidase [Chthoniobacter sp.]|nr:ImmA/IrrE family metallo-endopeptidase [Chthoniobacter sp.]
MKYSYKPKTRTQLKNLASKILEAYADRIGEHAVDIERIIERCKLEIIYRPMAGIPVEAYIARNPKYIVVNERSLYYMPRVRFTLAEELSHRVLEFHLWNNSDSCIPEGARVHELTPEQYDEIEHDARHLAAEIMMPEAEFRQRFQQRMVEMKNLGGNPLIKLVVREVARDFDMSPMAVAYRCKLLKLITKTVYNTEFSIVL